jgi:uncharacterized membrane-anchored protein YjiN (DUF445 family)
MSKEFTDAALAGFYRAIIAWPIAPALATTLEVAQQHGWHDRALTAISRAAADAMDLPRVQSMLNDIVDDALSRYRSSLRPRARVVAQLAEAFGMIDRDKMLDSLQQGMREVANDAAHPLRHQIAEVVGGLPERLRREPELAARVELLKASLVRSVPVERLRGDAADELHRWLVSDLRADSSETVEWLAVRLNGWRVALISDDALRGTIDTWAKTFVIQMVERYHDEVAAFIEQGMRTLGPKGAARLIEEHAADDLQYIRVNGTLVGGLTGGALYAFTLGLQFLGW